MGIFSSIKNAIFGDDDKDEKKADAPKAATSGFNRETKTVSEVDVEQRLDNMPGSDKLNWRTSIVDLMKLVGLDPSYQNRKELAHELGDKDYSGTAEENIWLHKQVMNKLAEHGGRVPPSLRD
ncbi:DUF3597 domain-containing protein [Aurantiacibacter aquimixticola]|uniref:DUF3597 domain-containing protein n=1 Tax=Aurantiacibacter aquimixticola TaxID=1958945 RepID=A0A419RRX6_9SPHN|nr:DUF3597 domain-containing protein [Aurantiacibacter aquimixticola]RJY08553.1 DUF3597 domain-containing protein [Aurantiacibacter aquimixticola]